MNLVIVISIMNIFVINKMRLNSFMYCSFICIDNVHMYIVNTTWYNR